MLGLAFSGAKRSEELFRLKHEGGSETNSKANSSQEGDETHPRSLSSGHKRTRRRRRAKKKSSDGDSKPTSSATSKKQHDAPMKKRDLYFCLRCGVVKVGSTGYDSAVGRVTLVNWDNEVVKDTFVKVPIAVADYHTGTTGITEKDLKSPKAISFDQARTQISKLIKGKILIGHGLEVDLAALGLNHPWCDMRDTATYAPFMKEVTDDGNQAMIPQDLAVLTGTTLKRVTVGCPVREAVACLDLYKMARNDWETSLIKIAQQKERQCKLVMTMRNGQGGQSGGMSVPLSAIREDEMPQASSLRQRDAHQYVPGPPHGRFPRMALMDDSTISSTTDLTATMLTSLAYPDDDSSSFVSQETDRSSSISSRFNSAGRYREIENMDYIKEKSGLHSSEPYPMQAYSSVRSAPHQNSQILEAVSTRSAPSAKTAPASRWDIWKSPAASKALEESSWSSQPGFDKLHNGTTHALPTEEEMLLPSELLADLEEDSGAAAGNQEGAQRSGSWFRPRRRSKQALVVPDSTMPQDGQLTGVLQGGDSADAQRNMMSMFGNVSLSQSLEHSFSSTQGPPYSVPAGAPYSVPAGAPPGFSGVLPPQSSESSYYNGYYNDDNISSLQS